MANIKSAMKRARQADRKRACNRAERSRIRTLRRQYQDAVAAGDKAKVQGLFKDLCSLLDKALKHGVEKANTVDRIKSRSAAKLAALK